MARAKGKKKRGKRNKRPRQKKHPAPGKEPRVAPAASSMDLKPSWRLSLLELVDPYGWHTLDLPTATTVRDKLAGETPALPAQGGLAAAV